MQNLFHLLRSWWVNHPRSALPAAITTNAIRRINEPLISIKLHCGETEAFAPLTCACLGLEDMRGCCCCCCCSACKTTVEQRCDRLPTPVSASSELRRFFQADGAALTVISSKPFYAWWIPTGERGGRQAARARAVVRHGCEEILLRRRRDGGRQRHIEADAEKCERVSERLVMTRSWLRRAGEAAALALTHLIPTGPPGWRHSARAVAFLCFNFFMSSSHIWASLASERLCIYPSFFNYRPVFIPFFFSTALFTLGGAFGIISKVFL